MSVNPGNINNFTAIQAFVDGQTTGEIKTGANKGDTVSLVFNDVTVDANGDPLISVGGVVKSVQTGDSSDDQTVKGNLTVDGTSSLDDGDITTTGAGGITMAGVLNTEGVDTATSGAHVLTPTFAASSAAQLTDTTRDYMVYLTVTTGGTVTTVKIGHTSAATDATILGSSSVVAGQLISFRLPAGWYVEWAGTTTAIADQSAVSC